VQLEVALVPTWASVQGLPVKLPEPLLVKVTVPCGHDVVPESVSPTVTVQVVAWLTATVLGVQFVTTVVVFRSVTVNANGVAELLLDL
jgi:hypothetical protein